MTLSQLYEDHLKLAVRLRANRPLRAGQTAHASPTVLSREIDGLERSEDFKREIRSFDEVVRDHAKYAVDALFDHIASDKFRADGDEKNRWSRRNLDPLVGHNFYRRLTSIADAGGKYRDELLELYVLCGLLGFEGDENARNDSKVRVVFAEIITDSAARRFSISWPGSKPPDLDLQIGKLIRQLRAAFLWTPVVYTLAIVAVYWIGWMGFPRLVDSH